MYAHRIILVCLTCLFSVCAFSQETSTGEAQAESARLYNENKWSELLKYGRSSLASGIDFPLLRMRTGYAAFVLGNYSESLKQYEYVYKSDEANTTALYYCYLTNLYLNNINAARYYGAKLTEEAQVAENLKSTTVERIGSEYSYKMPDQTIRGDGRYLKLDLTTHLGYRLQWDQAFAKFDQLISEPYLTAVSNNYQINIAQKELYTRLSYAVDGRATLTGGVHYLYTPFNNFIYNNIIGFGGVRYATPYAHLQALIQAGRIRDSSYTQVDATVKLYPSGNTKLYTVTTASLSKESAFTQVIGFRLVKKLWLEANLTAGRYSKLLSNDALYVYDDIDIKKLRAGAGAYFYTGKHLLLTAHYSFDQKEFFARPGTNYNQYSITGGVQWKF